MLFNATFIVGLCFFIILSIIDFLTYNKKKGYIPSILTTLFLIAIFILNGVVGLYLGALASLIALAFTDMNLWAGISDFKIFIAGAMAFPTLLSMLTFAVIVSIVAVAVKTILYFKVSKRKDWQFPFIPVMLIAYVIAMVMI